MSAGTWIGRVAAMAVLAVSVGLGSCKGNVNDDEVVIAFTTRASVSSAGAEGNNWISPWSRRVGISQDGRKVLFSSYSSNLVSGDTNFASDIFLRDLDAGTTTRISCEAPGNPDLVDDGDNANSDSLKPSFSADGRYVVFQSYAPDLVANDTNNSTDVFVTEVATGKTVRASIRADGAQLAWGGEDGSLSSDGRYVCFRTASSPIGGGDSNGLWDVYVLDRDKTNTGTFDQVGNISVTRISREDPSNPDGVADGEDPNGNCESPTISPDGRFVVFHSEAPDLVAGDTNLVLDVFVYDRDKDGNGTFDEAGPAGWGTTRVSVSTAGVQGNSHSAIGTISGDGRYVAFMSWSNNLVTNDTNNTADIFLHDRNTGTTTRVSVSSEGTETALNNESNEPCISDNGRFVVFKSDAPNLVRGDTNKSPDCFVRDTVNGITTRVSVATYGTEASPNWYAGMGALSADGRYAAFVSAAENLVGSDLNNLPDVFVRGPLH